MKTKLFQRIINKLINTKKSVSLAFRKPKYQAKVFCIGYNKTGTTSVGKALRMLGYSHSSFNRKVWREYYLQSKFDKVLDYTARFEAFDDLPWLNKDMIPLLDEKFPGSKFIYLIREESAWKNSMYNWKFKMTGTYPDIEEEWKKYKAHEKFVLNYFKDRTENEFIIIDVKEERAFSKLATFLNKEAPQDDFPHFNETSTDENKLR